MDLEEGFRVVYEVYTFVRLPFRQRFRRTFITTKRDW